MSSVVYQETSNDFTDNSQTINSRPIASVVYGPFPAPDSAITPDRFGMIYVQIKEGSPDKKTHMWISVNNGPAGEFIWEELFAEGDIPATVARTDKTNNFQPTEQQIAGHQILSFVDGGSQTPEQSKLPADYDGQFYIAVRSLSSGDRDVSIWVANGNQWLPFAGGGSIDTSRLAKLDVNNEFEGLQHFKESVFMQHNTNFIGEMSEARQVMGCRVKNSSVSPATDASWRPAMEGEICIFNNIGVTPNQLSIWMATNANSVGTSHWKQIYPTSGGGGGTFTPPDFVDNYSEKESDVRSGIGSDGKITLNTGMDKDKIAYIDKENLFIPLQRMGGGGNEVYLTGARVGHLAPKGIIVPITFGEIYLRQNIGTNDYEIWLATQQADTDSWVQIFDNVFADWVAEQFKQFALEDERLKKSIELMQGEVDGLETEVKDLEKVIQDIGEQVSTDMDTLTDKVDSFETEITSLKSVDQTLTTDVNELKAADVNITERVRLAEEEIIENYNHTETKFNTEREAMNQIVTDTVGAVELRVERLKPMVDLLETAMDDVQTRLLKAEHEITDLIAENESLKQQLVNIGYRLDNIEGTIKP